MSNAPWSTQQLSEFLEIFGALEQRPRLQLAIDRVAESLDAEVVALVNTSCVVESRGFPRGAVPTADLVACRTRRESELNLAGLGPCHVKVATVDDDSSLVVARRVPAFDPEESTLVRAMGRALGLAMANGALLGRLAERHELAERLFRIEQSISHRAPLQEVLDTITEGAAELLNADVVGIRVALDNSGPGEIASMWGAGPKGRTALAGVPVDRGFAGRAYLQDRLVVTDAYKDEADRVDVRGFFGTTAAMAAPIHRNGVPTGVISVASQDPQRRFTVAERDVLLTFAQHVSLAVNDASAVSELRMALVHRTHQAEHDSLTGLLNRCAVVERLNASLTAASPDNPVAVLVLDIDRFKSINDVLGHTNGDAVLMEVGRRLAEHVRSLDVIARLAGDEFLIVAEGMASREARDLADRLSRVISKPMELEFREIVLTASVGVAVSTSPMPGDDLLANADVAMYRAKQCGRSRVVHFDHEMRSELLRRSELEGELNAAIRAQDQLVVHYQPVYRIADGHIGGFEALIRWQHPRRGLLAAAEFVTVAEETGQISALDRATLLRATRQLAAWRSMGPRFANLSMAVNLSARQFADPDLVRLVDRSLRSSGVPSEALWLEITETILMEETTATFATLASLRELQVGLSVDDFGTGHSSLQYLKRFPVNTLKIDQTFVAGLCVDHDDEAIVTAIIRLAEALGLTTIAEGVERPEQLEWLAEQGCDMVQGYLLARPAPASDIEAMLRAEEAGSRESGGMLSAGVH